MSDYLLIPPGEYDGRVIAQFVADDDNPHPTILRLHHMINHRAAAAQPPVTEYRCSWQELADWWDFELRAWMHRLSPHERPPRASSGGIWGDVLSIDIRIHDWKEARGKRDPNAGRESRGRRWG